MISASTWNHDSQVSSAASLSGGDAGRSAEISAVIPEPELRRRRDFRGLPIVTIDGETARDFDDAVYVRNAGERQLRIAGAHCRRGAICDAGLGARPGSAAARHQRLFSGPRRAHAAARTLDRHLQLRPQVERLVLSCVMEMDHRGEIVGYELCEGVIRSAERMTYTAVNA
jgi:ribonuclease R